MRTIRKPGSVRSAGSAGSIRAFISTPGLYRNAVLALFVPAAVCWAGLVGVLCYLIWEGVAFSGRSGTREADLYRRAFEAGPAYSQKGLAQWRLFFDARRPTRASWHVELYAHRVSELFETILLDARALGQAGHAYPLYRDLQEGRRTAYHVPPLLIRDGLGPFGWRDRDTSSYPTAEPLLFPDATALFSFSDTPRRLGWATRPLYRELSLVGPEHLEILRAGRLEAAAEGGLRDRAARSGFLWQLFDFPRAAVGVSQNHFRLSAPAFFRPPSGPASVRFPDWQGDPTLAFDRERNPAGRRQNSLFYLVLPSAGQAGGTVFMAIDARALGVLTEFLSGGLPVYGPGPMAFYLLNRDGRRYAGPRHGDLPGLAPSGAGGASGGTEPPSDAEFEVQFLPHPDCNDALFPCEALAHVWETGETTILLKPEGLVALAAVRLPEGLEPSASWELLAGLHWRLPPRGNPGENPASQTGIGPGIGPGTQVLSAPLRPTEAIRRFESSSAASPGGSPGSFGPLVARYQNELNALYSEVLARSESQLQTFSSTVFSRLAPFFLGGVAWIGGVAWLGGWFLWARYKKTCREVLQGLESRDPEGALEAFTRYEGVWFRPIHWAARACLAAKLGRVGPRVSTGPRQAAYQAAELTHQATRLRQWAHFQARFQARARLSAGARQTSGQDLAPAQHSNRLQRVPGQSPPACFHGWAGPHFYFWGGLETSLDPPLEAPVEASPEAPAFFAGEVHAEDVSASFLTLGLERLGAQTRDLSVFLRALEPRLPPFLLRYFGVYDLSGTHRFFLWNCDLLFFNTQPNRLESALTSLELMHSLVTAPGGLLPLLKEGWVHSTPQIPYGVFFLDGDWRASQKTLAGLRRRTLYKSHQRLAKAFRQETPLSYGLLHA